MSHWAVAGLLRPIHRNHLMGPTLLILPQAIQVPAHRDLQADRLRRVRPDRPDLPAVRQEAAALLAARREAAAHQAALLHRKAAEGRPMTIPAR